MVATSPRCQLHHEQGGTTSLCHSWCYIWVTKLPAWSGIARCGWGYHLQVVQLPPSADISLEGLLSGDSSMCMWEEVSDAMTVAGICCGQENSDNSGGGANDCNQLTTERAINVNANLQMFDKPLVNGQNWNACCRQQSGIQALNNWCFFEEVHMFM